MGDHGPISDRDLMRYLLTPEDDDWRGFEDFVWEMIAEHFTMA